ncbi:MAG TPA: DinB family protein [Candidatus Polarisedimenticolia bacterium]|nr:DinB family protein [Candidatus Polarisedimenticolia bacterium]
MSQDGPLRAQLRKLLDWEDAHVDFDGAVDGIPPDLRGSTPAAIPFSPWQLLEHLRITQHDILDFCRDPEYRARAWPKDYWPSSPSPPTPGAWDESVARYHEDREGLKRLAADTSINLFALIPHGSGQTYLREILLVADHNSYHVGQLVLVRRGLGIWPGK